MEAKKRKKFSISSKKEGEPILKKHVGLIHCENKLTFLQRKICNIFLFNAIDHVEKEDIYEIPLRQLCSLIGYRSNDISLIKKSIRSLISTIMEWNLLEDGRVVRNENVHLSGQAIAWNASSLLAGATIERGVVRYSYSPQVRKVLCSLDIYGRINLFVQAKFSSVYSLCLYENCVRFKTVNSTGWLELELFRNLMGISKTQYASFKELKRNVITVAVDEINLKADIYLDVEYQKTGRSVTGIKFTIRDNENYQPSFKRITKASEQEASMRPQDQASLLEILSGGFKLKEKQAKELVQQYAAAYLLEKIDLVKRSKNVEHAGAYLISALKNDYQDSKPAVKKGVQTTYLREAGEASQVRSLKKKYIEYKFRLYVNYLTEHALLEKLQTEFVTGLATKNPIMASLFKKNGLQSLPAMTEFIEFVDQVLGSSHYIECLSFDEYLTEEEVVDE